MANELALSQRQGLASQVVFWAKERDDRIEVQSNSGCLKDVRAYRFHPQAQTSWSISIAGYWRLPFLEV